MRYILQSIRQVLVLQYCHFPRQANDGLSSPDHGGSGQNSLAGALKGSQFKSKTFVDRRNHVRSEVQEHLAPSELGATLARKFQEPTAMSSTPVKNSQPNAVSRTFLSERRS